MNARKCSYCHTDILHLCWCDLQASAFGRRKGRGHSSAILEAASSSSLRRRARRAFHLCTAHLISRHQARCEGPFGVLWESSEMQDDAMMMHDASLFQNAWCRMAWAKAAKVSNEHQIIDARIDAFDALSHKISKSWLNPRAPAINFLETSDVSGICC